MKTCILFLGIVFLLPSNVRAWPQRQSSSSPVQDTVVIKKVLHVVQTHILLVTKNRRRPIVIREGKKSRRFIVMKFLQPVTVERGTYTAQIDVDEFDHKIPRILYVDARPDKKSFRVVRIRIGPNHFRDDPPRQEKFPSP